MMQLTQVREEVASLRSEISQTTTHNKGAQLSVHVSKEVDGTLTDNDMM